METTIDRDTLNKMCASRKADREYIARELITIAAKHGAQTERRDEPRNPGYSGAGIRLTFTLSGVGATLDVDDLHGGDFSLIHWYNSEYPSRDYTKRFNSCVGSISGGRPHHKATSHPRDWYSLAMFLDSGLQLAACGGAFDSAS